MEKTLAKGLAVLEALLLCAEPAGVSEIAQMLGISKSNAHRLLRTLLELGFVDSRDGRYWATLKVWELGSQVIKRYDVRDHARPLMIQIAAQSHEEVRLAVFDIQALEVIYIDKVETTQDVRAFSEIGGRTPACCTASGMAFLAWQSDEVLTRAAAGLTARSPHTITDPAVFLDRLRQVRSDGFAINERQLSEQISGVGAPIFGHDNTVIASISVVGPAPRLPTERLTALGELLRKGCAEISAHINPPKPNVVRLRQNLEAVTREKRNLS